MARRAENGISFVEGKGYRFTIGKTKGDDGVERYKTGWLGREERAFPPLRGRRASPLLGLARRERHSLLTRFSGCALS